MRSDDGYERNIVDAVAEETVGASHSHIDHEKKRRLVWMGAVLVLAGGACLGFLTFYICFYGRFSQVMTNVEIRQFETLQELRDRLDVALQQKRQCLEDDSKVVQIGDLRGRLMAQGNLKVQHEELIQDYNRLLDELEALEGRQSDIGDLRAELEDAKAHVDFLRNEREDFERQVEEIQQVADQRSSLQVESLIRDRNTAESEKRECIDHIQQVAPQLDESRYRHDSIKNQIQQRQLSLCNEEHGKGPYYVQFTAKSKGWADDVSFVVELASRKQMPHSVFTFISLVEYQLYDGTVVVRDNNDSAVLVTTTRKDAAAEFQRKRRALGMEQTILMFEEESADFPCDQDSMGFQGVGPSVEFYTSEPSSSSDGKSCFGKVVRGNEAVKKLEQAISNGDIVEFVQVEHLLL